MKYAIFSDMHGNLEAYRSVIDAIEKEEVCGYFCVGDIVGYGANPVECIKLTRGLNPVIVCGNHDWASAGRLSIEYFNEFAGRAALWTASVLDEDDKDYLRSLPLVHSDGELTLVHGTLMRPQSFDYVFDFETAYQMMKMAPTKITFIGHSHVPGIFSLEDERLEYSVASKVIISSKKHYLVNVGSVGQPRDGDRRSSYCIWDRDTETVEIKRVQYDIKKAQAKIIEAGLPAYLAHRLSEGR